MGQIPLAVVRLYSKSIQNLFDNQLTTIWPPLLAVYWHTPTNRFDLPYPVACPNLTPYWNHGTRPGQTPSPFHPPRVEGTARAVPLLTVAVQERIS
jgi:hypothetical protein